MPFPRLGVSKAASTVLRNQSLAVHRVVASRKIHSTSIKHGEEQTQTLSSVPDTLDNETSVAPVEKTKEDSKPNFSSILDSSEESGEIDFHKLSEFIRNAYTEYNTPKPAPVDKQQSTDYFNTLFSQYDLNPKKGRKSNVGNLPENIKDELFSRCTAALKPTLRYLESTKNSHELYKYSVSLFQDFQKLLNEASRKTKKKNSAKSVTTSDDTSTPEVKKDDIFLSELSKGENKNSWTLTNNDYIEMIADQSELDPSKPVLNVLTVPILLTHIIKIFGHQFYNGQLALSLFDLLEKDVNLYAIAASQETFNEILRLVWINYGIVNLSEFQMRYFRMKFLGFPGDIVTLNILKIVISEYDNLSHGKLIFNKQGDSIYTAEANWRMKYFREEHKKIRTRLLLMNA